MDAELKKAANIRRRQLLTRNRDYKNARSANWSNWHARKWRRRLDRKTTHSKRNQVRSDLAKMDIRSSATWNYQDVKPPQPSQPSQAPQSPQDMEPRDAVVVVVSAPSVLPVTNVVVVT